MATGKRSLMNEHMIAVLSKVRGMDPEPVQKSYLYYSQAEKEAIDYMIAIDLLTEKMFVDEEGNPKKGHVIGSFGKEVARDVIRVQMNIDLQERIFQDPTQETKVSELNDIRTELNSAIDDGFEEKATELRKRMEEKEKVLMDDYQKTVERQIEELDHRGQKKMDAVSKWKQQKKNQ